MHADQHAGDGTRLAVGTSDFDGFDGGERFRFNAKSGLERMADEIEKAAGGRKVSLQNTQSGAGLVTTGRRDRAPVVVIGAGVIATFTRAGLVTMAVSMLTYGGWLYVKDRRWQREHTALAMLAVTTGHIWPVQLRFRGGKGVATSLGALLIYDWRLALTPGGRAAQIFGSPSIEVNSLHRQAIGRLAEGLAVAHDMRVVHRDLKPSNVMLKRTGIAKVIDIGSAMDLRWAAARRVWSRPRARSSSDCIARRFSRTSSSSRTQTRRPVPHARHAPVKTSPYLQPSQARRACGSRPGGPLPPALASSRRPPQLAIHDLVQPHRCDQQRHEHKGHS